MTTPKDRLLEAEADLAALGGVRALGKANAKARELRALLRASEAQVEALEGVVTAYESARGVSTKPLRVKKRRTRDKPPAVPVIAVSDLHLCELVTPGQTNGVNEHDRDIGEERTELLFRNAVTLIKDEQARVNIREAVLWLGGDFMVNEIHDDLMRSCAQTPLEEMEHATGVLRRGIDYMLAKLDVERLLVPCSFGNHGRSTPKPMIAQASRYSYEQAMYRTLAGWYADDDRIEFLVTESAIDVVDLGGFRLGVHHGDSVKYGGGVGGLAIPLGKATKAWQQNEATRADLYVIGHFHQFKDFGDALVNGCGVGYNGYAAWIKARPEPPQQGFFLIDMERRQKTVTAPIFLT